VRYGFLDYIIFLVRRIERENKTAVKPISTLFSEKYIGKGKLYMLSTNSLANTHF